MKKILLALFLLLTITGSVYANSVINHSFETVNLIFWITNNSFQTMLVNNINPSVLATIGLGLMFSVLYAQKCKAKAIKALAS